MGIFSRISDIVSANLNEMVEKFEDPQKMLKQAIREMETTIEEAKRNVVRSMADEKMIAKELAKNRKQAELWAGRAETAVGDDNDDLARKALSRRREHEKLVAALDDQQAASAQTTGTLRRQLEGMRAKLAEAKRRLGTLVARKRAADVRGRIGKTAGQASVETDAFRKFDRMREKVEQAEAEASTDRNVVALPCRRSENLAWSRLADLFNSGSASNRRASYSIRLHHRRLFTGRLARVGPIY